MNKRKDLTISQVFYDATKWSGKRAFGFLILTVILLAITLSNANPKFNSYSIEYNQTLSIKVFDLDESKQFQFIFFTENEKRITIELIKIDENQVESIVFSLKTAGGVRDVNFSPGQYRLQVSNFGQINSTIETVVGYGNVNYGLLGALAISAVLMVLSMALFWSLLPFSIIAIIINSTNKSHGSKQVSTVIPSQNQSKEKFTPAPNMPESVQRPISTSNTQQVISTDKFDANGAYIYNVQNRETFSYEDIFENFIKSDWVIFSFGILFLIMFFFDTQTPLLVLSFITIGAVVYNVSEREKTKKRILILLNENPNTNVLYLAKQLDKKRKHVRKTLGIMMYEDFIPIIFNPINDMVTLKQRVVFSKPSQTGKTIRPIENISASSTNSNHSSIVTDQNDEFKSILDPKQFCSNCGVGLVEEVKYCYTCGEKQK